MLVVPNNTQIEINRRRLESERRSLLASLQIAQEEGEQLFDAHPAELGEMGSDYSLARIVNALGERELLRVREVIAALERIHDGCYGLCEECECDIGRGRLEAIPEARLCVRCAEKLERANAARPGLGNPSGP